MLHLLGSLRSEHGGILQKVCTFITNFLPLNLVNTLNFDIDTTIANIGIKIVLKEKHGSIRPKKSLSKRRPLQKLSRRRLLLQRKQALLLKFNLKLKFQRRNQLLHQKKPKNRRRRLLRSLSNKNQQKCLSSRRTLQRK
jgi:hypothetical protein